MKKIFIDCGANDGNSIRKFNSEYGYDYHIHSFECNPKLYDTLSKLKSENVHVYNQAVWTYNGDINFYIGDIHSSSLIKKKITGNLDINNPVKVPCVDIAQFIRQFHIDDYIILKLDIEGAEYAVIEHLYKTDTLKYINKLYGEWHARKIKLPASEHTKINDMVLESKLIMYNWDAVNY